MTTKHKEQKILNHPIQKLYDLILDVNAYPDFLPWVYKAKIHENYENYFIAELFVEFKGFKTSYTSKVIYEFDESGDKANIDVELVKGPFKHLINKWHLEKIDEKQTKIDFFIQFSFNNFMFEKLIGIFFTHATKKMINSFEKRADAIN